ncbi:MAG: complex I NDUFA9 subunit family protein, partial [Pseudomonadota bacterium]
QHGGAIYELGGPDQLSMLEINQRIALAQDRKRAFLPMPDALSALFAAMPLTPMSRDQWTLLKPGSIVSGAHRTFADLGIEPRALSEFLDHWMRRFAKRTSGTSNTQSSGKAAT